MDVAIAGGHGQIALILERLLAEAGHNVRGIIRNPDHAGDVEATGAQVVVFDLEQDDGLAEHLEGVDAVVFAAGAGPGSGAERKLTLDRDGAVKLIDACTQKDVRRYVMVSAMGAKPDVEGDEVFQVYLRAKFQADEALRASGLDFTIIRPGGLTNDAGTGHIALEPELERGQIPRVDVAETLAAVLEADNTIGKTLDLVEGDTPIAQAVAAA